MLESEIRARIEGLRSEDPDGTLNRMIFEGLKAELSGCQLERSGLEQELESFLDRRPIDI